eukprot:GHRR01003405.1.p1 GENE.GHRR01003405.1~~GHRR01003405.1.p1  ORF type:complete len:282 (+),score=67.66 GHRR01003405.1:203-1048(+)
MQLHKQTNHPQYICSRPKLFQAGYQPASRSITAAVSALTCNAANGDWRDDRRAMLASLSVLGLNTVALSAQPAAQAAVTLTVRSKPQLKSYTLKAGYNVTVPDSWTLAYDRSDSAELGTQVLFGNFRSFETLSIFKLQQRTDQAGASLDPQQLLEQAIAQQRDNQSTYHFKLLSGPTPTAREVLSSSAGGDAQPEQQPTTYYDSEYELAVCRGLIQEGIKGRRRCVGPNDIDLQVVSRHFYQTLAASGGYIYIVRGSCTSDKWQEVGPLAVQAVHSFSLAA